MKKSNPEQTPSEGITRPGSGKDMDYGCLDHLLPGTRVQSRYEIRERIGSGGFGVVFSAWDQVLRSEVALKFLHPGLSRDRTRFHRVRREINLSRRIADPRIVRVFSLEMWKGLHFLVMERVRGRSLADYLEEKAPLAWEEFAPTFHALLSGVAVLHQHGIIHRDLKPSNIFLLDKEIKILDFGMAKALDDTEKTAGLDEIVGSPLWMSPEQIQGRKVDVASDVYQLGLILYRALSGSHPFASEKTTMKILMSHLQDSPLRLAKSGIQIPRFLQAVLSRALEKKPRFRFAHADDMAAALRGGRTPRFWIPRWWRRRIAVAAVCLLILVGAGLWRASLSDMNSVDLSGTYVTGRNFIGIQRWKRDFSPFSVFQAFPVRLRNVTSLNWSFQPRGDRGAVVLLNHPGNNNYPPDHSICSDEVDNCLAVLDGRGREMNRESFWARFRLDEHGFTKRFYVHRYESRDVDGDGRLEQIMCIRQSQSMYPAALVVMQGLNTFVYTSPGVISWYHFVDGVEGGKEILIMGMANPLAHTCYLARVPFETGIPDCHVDALPNMIKSATGTRHGMRVLLPGAVGIHGMDPDGSLRMWNKRTGDSLTWIPRKGLLMEDQDNHYLIPDDPRQFSRALTAMHKAYRARALHHGDKALNEIVGVLPEPISNPYLKSALLYWAGDLLVERGDLKRGRRRLDGALAAYRFNMDAACRLCELTLLEGNPVEAVRLAEDRFSEHGSFWGLTRGNHLFQAWGCLHMGDFRRARETLKQLFLNVDGMATAFMGLTDIFSGDYASAARAFEDVSRYPPNLFTVAEFRLFYARAMVSSGRNLQRAKFFLKDLETHSLRQGWRAGLLLAWLDARAGERSAALGNRTREAWDLIQRRSQGDFQARLWLFLDAWCYGRTMEALGNRQAAREGYRACVRANPHSGAAADARIRLRSLSG